MTICAKLFSNLTSTFGQDFESFFLLVAMATSFLPGIEFFEQLKKKTTKDYSCVAWRRSTQRFRRCDLKQMLTDDDGYPIITTVHF